MLDARTCDTAVIKKARRGDAGGSSVRGAQGGPHSVGCFACYRDDPATVLPGLWRLAGGVFPLSGSVDKEVFEQEAAFARHKWAPTTDAGNVAVACRGGFYPDDLVHGITVRTRERRGRIEHNPTVPEFVGSWESRYARCLMPRKQPKLILAAFRAAEARRIVANQRGLIAVLQAKGEPTLEAEGMLEVYLSSLKLLEDHE